MDECEVVFDADSGQPDVSASQAVKEGKIHVARSNLFLNGCSACPGTQDGTNHRARGRPERYGLVRRPVRRGKVVALKGNDTYGMMIDYFRAIDDAVVDAALANASEWSRRNFATKTPTRETFWGCTTHS